MTPTATTPPPTADTGVVVCLQNRPHKAGAQTCLWRLLVQTQKRWPSVLVTSKPGWLVEACQQEGIPVLIHPFPNSRSLSGRLWQNRLFAREVAARLEQATLRPLLVQGNDHQEGLLTVALSRRLRVPAALLLRDSGMRQEDYFKYQAPRCQWIAAIGQVLRDRVAGWDPARTIHTLHDGILPQEVQPPLPRRQQPPDRLLIIGSPQPHKGWADLVTALAMLEEQGILRTMAVDFTGDPPSPNRNDLDLRRLSRCTVRFLGRVNDFHALVRQYELVINPSRRESFGMAAIEVLASGVPLLSSRTGIIEQVIEDPRYLYPAGDAPALAAALSTLLHQWPTMEPDIGRCQTLILQRFPLE
ncbi:MAG: glycosyltransferase family 4 protein, partial [Magnetococcales bacterium]|nr:glycosyltransferase family 4 protein [Magnetococcales bacterium]